MALSAGSAALGATKSRALNRLAYDFANKANSNSTVATDDIVVTIDKSADYEVKYSTLLQLATGMAITGSPAAGGFTTSARCWHTGYNPPAVSTDFSDYTVVATEVIIAEVFVPANATLTGVALFNGSAVAGNVKVGLANSAGAVVATSASTAQAGTDTIQRVPFTATYAAVGPATYYVLAIGDTGGGTSKINTHTIGNFGAAKQTGQVYATGFTTITAPTTFTTALGPVASLY